MNQTARIRERERERDKHCVSSQCRDKTFDIAKGLGILFVVLGHSYFPYCSFVSLFHMPLFFIISGYFFKDTCFDSIGNVYQYIKRKAKSLALPFILINSVLVFLHNYFLEVNILTDNPDFLEADMGNNEGLSKFYRNIPYIILYTVLLQHVEQIATATWFLKALFWMSIFFCIGSYLLKILVNNKKQFVIFRIMICIVCCCVGYLLHKIDFNFYKIGTMLSCSICFEMGIMYKQFKDTIRLSFKSGLLCFTGLVIFLNFHPKSFLIAGNDYNNLLGLIFCSVCGFLLVMYFSEVINKNQIFSGLFSYIGSRTMSILCLHIVFFKFIVLLQVKTYNLPDYMLASFHVYNPHHFWWLAYTFVGIIGPLLLEYIYQQLKSTFRNRFIENK